MKFLSVAALLAVASVAVAAPAPSNAEILEVARNAHIGARASGRVRAGPRVIALGDARRALDGKFCQMQDWKPYARTASRHYNPRPSLIQTSDLAGAAIHAPRPSSGYLLPIRAPHATPLHIRAGVDDSEHRLRRVERRT